jgi:MYXO-CTERM domain-containing protein
LCSGTTADCPVDGFVAADTECRVSTGPCDPAERCSGAGADCPEDDFAVAGTVCRATAGACDVPETCGGTGAACPDDHGATEGDPCDDGIDWTTDETCVGGLCSGAEQGACDQPVMVAPLPFVHASTTHGRPDHVGSYGDGCGTADLALGDVIYSLDLAPGEAVAISVTPEALGDVAVVVVDECAAGRRCLAFGDNAGEGGVEELTFESLTGGSYFIVVEQRGGSGDYTLRVTPISADDADASADADAGADAVPEDAANDSAADASGAERGGGCGCRASNDGAGEPLLLIPGIALALLGRRRRPR